MGAGGGMRWAESQPLKPHRTVRPRLYWYFVDVTRARPSIERERGGTEPSFCPYPTLHPAYVPPPVCPRARLSR